MNGQLLQEEKQTNLSRLLKLIVKCNQHWRKCLARWTPMRTKVESPVECVHEPTTRETRRKKPPPYKILPPIARAPSILLKSDAFNSTCDNCAAKSSLFFSSISPPGPNISKFQISIKITLSRVSNRVWGVRGTPFLLTVSLCSMQAFLKEDCS